MVESSEFLPRRQDNLIQAIKHHTVLRRVAFCAELNKYKFAPLSDSLVNATLCNHGSE